MVQIGVIGCGSIGGGLARLLAKSNTVYAIDKDEKRAQQLVSCGVRRAEDLKQLVAESDIVLLAIKPQDLGPLAKKLTGLLYRGHTIVSTLAGISSRSLRRVLKRPKIVRLAPNLALTCGQGLLAIEESRFLTDELRSQMQSLFEPAGEVVFLPTSQMDAVIALSGSGLAFVATMVQGMIDGAIAIGFTADMALKLVPAVFEGTAALLRQEGATPEALRWRVSSPAGTTVDGLQVMEEGAVRAAISGAVRAAFMRAEELRERCSRER